MDADLAVLKQAVATALGGAGSSKLKVRAKTIRWSAEFQRVGERFWDMEKKGEGVAYVNPIRVPTTK